MVKDIYTGAGSSEPNFLTNVNGTLYFNAYNNVSGRELWKSDGTSAGTIIVRDIVPGSQSGFPRYLFSFMNKLIFIAIDDKGIDVLWESDGTFSGTKMVYEGDLVLPSSPPFYTPVNEVLYFAGGLDNSGIELLKYNPATVEIGKESLSDTDILIYPNPSTGSITIKYDNIDYAPATFYLLDMTGKKITEMEMRTSPFQINLKGIDPGIYIYEVKTGKNNHRGKIVLR
jgi:ELWxxDGT repeat protein